MSESAETPPADLADLYELLKEAFEKYARAGATSGAAARELWPLIMKMIEDARAESYEDASAVSYKRYVLGEGM